MKSIHRWSNNITSCDYFTIAKGQQDKQPEKHCKNLQLVSGMVPDAIKRVSSFNYAHHYSLSNSLALLTPPTGVGLIQRGRMTRQAKESSSLNGLYVTLNQLGTNKSILISEVSYFGG